jgi:hypothetical protein
MPVFPGFQALFGFFDYKRKDARGGGGLAAGLACFMFLRAASGMVGWPAGSYYLYYVMVCSSMWIFGFLRVFWCSWGIILFSGFYWLGA